MHHPPGTLGRGLKANSAGIRNGIQSTVDSSYTCFSIEKKVYFRTKVRLSAMFLENASPPKLFDAATQILQLNGSHLSNILCDLGPEVKGQIMYFLENASPP